MVYDGLGTRTYTSILQYFRIETSALLRKMIMIK